MMRQRFSVLLWLTVVLIAGFVAGRMSVSSSWPKTSGSELQDVDFSSMLSRAKASSHIIDDNYAIIILDRSGMLDQLELKLAAQLTLNKLLRMRQEDLLEEIYKIST